MLACLFVLGCVLILFCRHMNISLFLYLFVLSCILMPFLEAYEHVCWF